MPLGAEVDLGPGYIVLDGDPQKGEQHPQFWPMYCGQTAAWLKMPALGTAVGLGQATLCYMRTQLPLKGAQQSPNFRPMPVVAKRLDGSRCHLVWR